MESKDLCFDRNKVWLAELKYYSKENNGIEYCDPISYAFVVELGDGEYANPFDVSDEFPVFTRTLYANYTSSGEAYGTKVFLANNIDKTGPCFVLNKKVADMGFNHDIVMGIDMIDYMFNSGLYFKDRKQFAKERFKGHPLKLKKFMMSEAEDESKMVQFLAERKAHIRKIK